MVDSTILPGYEFLQTLQEAGIEAIPLPTATRVLLARLEHNHGTKEDALDNAVHPLFTYANWLGVDWNHYELLKPALRVATLLLQQPSLLLWWKHTLFGVRQQDAVKGHVLVRHARESTVAADEELLKALEKILPSMLRLSYHAIDIEDRQCDGLSFSSTKSYDMFEAGTHWWPPMHFTSPRIILHTHFHHALERLQKHGAPGELENVQLRIAITLTHELAHILYKYRLKGDMEMT